MCVLGDSDEERLTKSSTEREDPRRVNPKTNNVLPFAGALFSALGLGSGLNFASCSGEEKSRSELLKEMSSSTDRIKRYLDAENAVKDLENKANENKKKWSNVDSSQIPRNLRKLKEARMIKHP